EWIEIAGDGAVVAQTLFLAGEGQKELIDGDIFFLLGELQEAVDKVAPGRQITDPMFMISPKLVDSILQTNIHEMGHLLGLHHQFDPSISSIMSYKDDRRGLQDYDVKAIQALYED
ncbi:MAG: matrixin family metalloprotease, partial [Bdellovibrionaceae bacterium]|nr:matrixin family metalloprotease [Pseudobdellovibrionaceae bacterium]